MNNANLNAALLRSVYCFEGLNGAFLAALSTPLAHVVKVEDFRHSREGFPVELAVIPALRIRRLRINLRTAKGLVTKAQRRFARLIEAGKDDAEGSLSSEWAGSIGFLRADVAEAEAGLAEALAN
jgi:hypothetical protein